MNKNKYFAISIPKLEKQDFDYIQSIRQQYDVRYYHILPSHFTMFSNLTLSCWQFLKDNLQATFSCHESFYFTIESAMLVPPSLQHQYWYAFLIPSQGFGHFYKIHTLAQKDLLADDLKQHVPFIPHITVGSFAKEQDCKILVNKINQSNIKIKGAVDSILLATIVDGQLQFVDELVLEDKLSCAQPQT